MDTELITVIPYEGYDICIKRLLDIESPREYNYVSSVFWNNSKRHRFDDEERPIEEIINEMSHSLKSEFKRQYVYMPVYIYEHGGISISTSPSQDKWDSGLFGILGESKANIRKEFNRASVSQSMREKIAKRLESEVEEMNSWYNGDVYTYSILKNDKTVIDNKAVYYEHWGKQLLKDAYIDIRKLIK